MPHVENHVNCMDFQNFFKQYVKTNIEKLFDSYPKVYIGVSHEKSLGHGEAVELMKLDPETPDINVNNGGLKDAGVIDRAASEVEVNI